MDTPIVNNYKFIQLLYLNNSQKARDYIKKCNPLSEIIFMFF